MFFIWVGRRLYGRIDRVDGVCIATQFTHAYGVPLVPGPTFLVLREMGTRFESLPLPRSGRSIAAGYLRVWGILGALVALSTVAFALPGAGALGKIGLGAAAIAATLPALWAWFVVGQLSPDEIAQRCVQARFSRVPCDVALLGASLGDLAEKLRAHLAERAAATPIGNYRAPERPASQWRAAALDPSLHDADFLGAAFTLARIEAHAATDPSERAALAELERDLWARLVAEHPDYIAASRPKAEKKMSARSKLALAVTFALVAVGGVAAIAWASSHTALHIVNASSEATLSILVDGQVVEGDVPQTSTEDASRARVTHLAHGEHEVEARDASGRVIDHAHVTVGPGTESLLYAPGRQDAVCFALETAEYGEASNPLEPIILLDRSKSLLDVGPRVDIWFGAPPSSVVVKDRDHGVVRRAVRQLRCPAPKR